MKNNSIFDELEAEAEEANHYVTVSYTNYYGASLSVTTSLT